MTPLKDPLETTLRTYKHYVRNYVKHREKLKNPINQITGEPLRQSTLRHYEYCLRSTKQGMKEYQKKIKKYAQMSKAERLKEVEKSTMRRSVMELVALCITLRPNDINLLATVLSRIDPDDTLYVLDYLNQLAGQTEELKKILTAMGHFKQRFEVIQGGA